MQEKKLILKKIREWKNTNKIDHSDSNHHFTTELQSNSINFQKCAGKNEIANYKLLVWPLYDLMKVI